jgi:hypothetical protein
MSSPNCWILAYLSQNTSSTKRDKAKEKNESDREIRKSGGTNRNKQWDKKARTLQGPSGKTESRFSKLLYDVPFQ